MSWFLQNHILEERIAETGFFRLRLFLPVDVFERRVTIGRKRPYVIAVYELPLPGGKQPCTARYNLENS